MSVVVQRDVPFSLRDGTRCFAEVWSPDDGRAHPAVHLCTPYFKEQRVPLPIAEPRTATALGYRLVVVDHRGTAAPRASSSHWSMTSTTHQPPRRDARTHGVPTVAATASTGHLARDRPIHWATAVGRRTYAKSAAKRTRLSSARRPKRMPSPEVRSQWR
jgi:hypothetical protein